VAEGGKGGNGLSLGVKSREFPRQLNHSTRQAKGFDSADKSGVLSRMGGTKVKVGVGVGATIKVVQWRRTQLLEESHALSLAAY
jgi:hypothetical protein